MAGVRIRKNDEVQIIAGKDKGKRGRVVNVLPSDKRIMVEGVARAKRHSRAGSRRSKSGSALQQGGIIDIEQFIDLSNVQLVCRACGRATRIGSEIHDGVKARICKRCGAEI
jgi:large subunit ribosomal protein L24